MTSSIPESDETYVPVSRGFGQYQKTYTAAAQSMFLHFLFVADWRLDSPEYGTLWTGYADIADALGLSGNTVRRCLKELEQGYPLGMLSRSGEPAPAFIEILGSKGVARSKRIRVRILKAKLSPKCYNRKNGNGKPAEPLLARARASAKVVPAEVDPETAAAEVEDVVGRLIGSVADKVDVRKLFEGDKSHA